VYILFFKIRLYPKKMFLLNILKINWNINYCGITGTNVRGFCGPPLPMNLYDPLQTSIHSFIYLHKYYLNCIIYLLPTNLCPHERVKYSLPTNTDLHELKWFRSTLWGQIKKYVYGTGYHLLKTTGSVGRELYYFF
jgi:hypothetical protein